MSILRSIFGIGRNPEVEILNRPQVESNRIADDSPVIMFDPNTRAQDPGKLPPVVFGNGLK